MHPNLITRINEQEIWTFQDCLGLGAEFNLKPRFIIALVLAQGKQYVDGESLPQPDTHTTSKSKPPG